MQGLKISSGRVTRRAAVGIVSAAAIALSLSTAVSAQDQTIRIGYVTPQSGTLAAFSEADDFIVGQLRDLLAEGIDTASGKLNVEIIVKDSQSNPNRAAEVARELVVNDDVQMIVVASTPETANPVSTQCEIEGLPCISTIAPWQPWFIGRQANPGDPASWESFRYTYHFFWGLEDVIANFAAMWDQLDTNKQVGRGKHGSDAEQSEDNPACRCVSIWTGSAVCPILSTDCGDLQLRAADVALLRLSGGLSSIQVAGKAPSSSIRAVRSGLRMSR